MKSATHTLAGRGSLHGAATYALLIERDALALLEWIGETPNRLLSTHGLRDYALAKGWTPGYLKAAVERAKVALAKSMIETADQAKARLSAQSQEAQAHCIKQVRDAQGAVIVDPETGDASLAIDQENLLEHLKFQRDLLVPKDTEKKLHIHASFVARMPEPAKSVEEWQQRTDSVLPFAMPKPPPSKPQAD